MVINTIFTMDMRLDQVLKIVVKSIIIEIDYSHFMSYISSIINCELYDKLKSVIRVLVVRLKYKTSKFLI